MDECFVKKIVEKMIHEVHEEFFGIPTITNLVSLCVLRG